MKSEDELAQSPAQKDILRRENSSEYCAEQTNISRRRPAQGSLLRDIRAVALSDRHKALEKQRLLTTERCERLGNQINALAKMMLAERAMAEKHLRTQIAAAENLMRNHLAYRLGTALINVARNPFRLCLLPFELIRQRIAYGRCGLSRPERTLPEAPDPLAAIGYVRPMAGTKPVAPAASRALPTKLPVKSVPVDIEIARSMALRSLAKLDDENLAALQETANADGDLFMQKRLAEMRWMQSRSAKNADRLRFILGRLKELDTGWLPLVRGSNSFVPEPDRILHLFKVFYPWESSGGAVRNWSIWRNQAQRDQKPIAVLPPGPFRERSRPGGTLIAEHRTEPNGSGKIYSHHLPAYDSRSAPPHISLAFEACLADHIARIEKPSIIHAASGFRGYDSALKGLAIARAHNLPFVYEVRSFHEHVWGPMRPDIMDLDLTKRRIAQENRCMRAADAVVTISKTMAREIVARGVGEEKITIVPNCVNTDFLEHIDNADGIAFRDRWGLAARKIIGSVSSLSAREGHNILIEAFARVASVRRDVDLLIVGAGPEADTLRNLIERYEIGDRVVMTGLIDHGEIAEAYAAIDIFVVPRIKDYASDFVTPMKPFEAMAAGCAVIMSDRPVSKEVVGNDRGFTFRTGEATDLARWIENCLDNATETGRRARVAQKWVRTNRQWRNVIGRYDAVYAAARTAHSRYEGCCA